MEPFILFEALRSGAAEVSAPLLSAVVKGSLVFAGVGAAALAMRKAHPRLRSLLWMFAVAAYGLILAVALAVPPLSFEVGNPFRQAELRATFAAIVEPRPVAARAVLVPAASPEPGDAVNIQGAGQVAKAPGAAAPAAGPWPRVLAAAWILGVLLTGLPVILGKLRLARLARSARTPDERRVLDLLGALRAQMGIRRAVSVRVSSRCAVPFTWRERRPVIMLPESVAGGRLEKLRSIFLHELRHVAWHDALARAFVRVLCAVFWFVPFIWIARDQLFVEQEKACDREAVEGGACARRYAACILEIARAAGRPSFLQSVGLAGQRKKVLEDRIRSIVRGGKAMKKSAWVLAATLLVLVALVVLGCAATREKLTQETAWKKLVGTWVNTAYAGPQPYVQKLVIKSGLTGEDWLMADSPAADGTWVVTPKKFWTDAQGNVYLQGFNRYNEEVTASGVPTGTARVLFRTDKSANTLELTAALGGAEGGVYPEKINPEAKPEYLEMYFIYHRK